jgi:hypothetical protein
MTSVSVTQLAAVHRAVAAKVKTIAGDSVNVSPWPMSASPTPLIEVWPGDDYLNYYDDSDSNAGLQRVSLRLRLDVAAGDGESAFLLVTDLLSWNGPRSIRAGIMSDRSLGGKVDDAVVRAASWEVDDEGQVAVVPIDVYVQKENT